MELKEGLIVSCQALKGEPMYGGDSTIKFAYAAYLAGAKGIRANSVRDINKISKKIKGKLPIIGFILLLLLKKLKNLLNQNVILSHLMQR